MLRLNSFECALQIGAQRFHIRAVGGEVDLDHAAEDVAALQAGDDRFERGGIAGQDGRSGAVADGDRHAVFVAGDGALGVGDGKVHCRHRAAANRWLDEAAARADYADRVVEAERACHVSCSHFAHAVADDGVRLDTP